MGNLVLLMAPHFAFPLVSQHGYQVIITWVKLRKSKHTRHPTMCQGWLMVLMASDVGLFLGARTSSRFLGSGPPGKGITVALSRLLLLPWLITYAIHILFTCILGPLVVAGAVTVVQHFRSVFPVFREEQIVQFVSHILSIAVNVAL